jgi:hypothetical protein
MPRRVQVPLSPVVDTTVRHEDWRDDLFKHGFVVVKDVMGPERAAYYVDRMFQWLETFPYGFDQNDRSTWNPEHLPRHMKYVKALLAPERGTWLVCQMTDLLASQRRHVSCLWRSARGFRLGSSIVSTFECISSAFRGY